MHLRGHGTPRGGTNAGLWETVGAGGSPPPRLKHQTHEMPAPQEEEEEEEQEGSSGGTERTRRVQSMERKEFQERGDRVAEWGRPTLIVSFGRKGSSVSSGGEGLGHVTGLRGGGRWAQSLATQKSLRKRVWEGEACCAHGAQGLGGGRLARRNKPHNGEAFEEKDSGRRRGQDKDHP